MFTKKTLIILGIWLYVWPLMAQRQNKDFTIDANYFAGSVLRHHSSMLHLTNGRPKGFILSWNKKTFGDKAWQARYNYPDYGASLFYHDLGNSVLGQAISANAHINFYFINRQLVLKVGQGIGYVSNPFNKKDNPKNIAISTQFTSSTFLMLNYKTKKIFDHFNFQAGLLFSHYSIGNVRAPNKGLNTVGLNVGVSYDFSDGQKAFMPLDSHDTYSRRIGYNFLLRSGINQSDIVGMDRFPFFVFSAYADRKISHTSALQFGTDVFLSYFLREYIKYQSLRDDGMTDPDTDFKRIGLFAGHELMINDFSVITQIGYYVYYPFEYAQRIYLRAGLQYRINERFFGMLSIKSHAADAEALEIGIGIKL